MEVNKSIEVRVDHGKEYVQELGFDKFSDQHGDLKWKITTGKEAKSVFKSNSMAKEKQVLED